MYFTSVLSFKESGLSYSTLRKSAPGNKGYYLNETMVVLENGRRVDLMNKQNLINMRADDISRTLVNLTRDIRRNRDLPFEPGLDEELNDIETLTENIKELYKHPRKNQKLLRVLNSLTNSYAN